MDSDKPAKSGFLQIAVAVLVVGLLGAGSGYVFSMLSLPTPAPATTADKAKPAVEALAKPDTKSKSVDAGANAEGMKTSEIDPPEIPEPVDESVNLKDYVLTPLPPLVANLAEPSSVWIRLEGSLVVRKGTEIKVADLGQQVAPFILAYLKTVNMRSLQGANGLNSLYSDLNQIVRSASNGDVHSVLLTGFIAE